MAEQKSTLSKKFFFFNVFSFSKKSTNSKTGKILLCLVLFLVLFGLLMVYSASFYMAEKNYNNQCFFLLKQSIGAFLGLISLFFFSHINYNNLSKFRLVFLIASIILLALVFVPGLGVENYGAKRWLNLGFFTIQPSEIAKFAFVLFASSYFASKKDSPRAFSSLLPVVFAGGSICLLIILEPNMSITMCVGFLLLFMLFVGGVSAKQFLFLLVPILIAVPVLIMLEPYRIARLVAFINPWANPKGEGYQLIQSFYSISSGGLFGVGLFSSRQKYLFLPFAESDFIFSIIAEEWGIVGSVAILLVYLGIIICGIKIALNARNRFGAYLASGITAVIGIQTILNLCVVTGLIPPTGLPLPFISFGSTSLVVFLSAIGVLLNISKQSEMLGTI